MKKISALLALVLGATTVPISNSAAIVNGDLSESWNGYTVSIHSTDSHVAAQRKNEENPLYKSHYCAGTLVTPVTVITSAWCVVNTENNKFLEKLDPANIFVGGGRTIDDSTPTYAVDTIWVNPNYSPRFYLNDIAVIKLSEAVEGSAPLAVGTSEGDTQGTIYGWGSTMPNWDRSGHDFLNILQVGHLKILSDAVCSGEETGFIQDERIYPNSTREIRKNIDKFHCAAGVTSKEIDPTKTSNFIDACYTDEGTGLVDTRTNTLVGVAIHDLGCAGAAPRLYTKVSSYMDSLPANMFEY